MRDRYRRRPGTEVVAVQLDLDTTGFAYQKWGGVQICKRGDWLVNNDGDTYTVDADSFARTYSPVGRGLFQKSADVWAERATMSGSIHTKEGATHYEAGDWLIFNERDGRDGYAMKTDAFERLYETA